MITYRSIVIPSTSFEKVDNIDNDINIFDYTENEKIAIESLTFLLLVRLRQIVSNLDIYVATVETSAAAMREKGLWNDTMTTFVCEGLLDHVENVKKGLSSLSCIDFSRMIRFLYGQGMITRSTFNEKTWAEMEAMYGRVKVVKHMVFLPRAR